MKYKLKRWPGYPFKLTSRNQPDLRPISRLKYENQADYTVIISDENDVELKITVPQMFISDGASVPRVVWTTSGLTPDGLIRAAALVHDYLYRIKGNLTVETPFRAFGKDLVKIERKYADKIFLDLILASGLWAFRARLAYYAVRVFGPRW